MADKTISHYKILGTLGKGGMGIVYKAEDTRLHRTVAVKVVLESRVSDPQVRQRFEREARTISGLNHPHICTLYDIGQEDGNYFLVMEYVEGKPLKGPMPVEDTLKLAVQIADALHHAHKRGVVHRDIKPANILINKSGAKLLDFGLAKLMTPPDDEDSDASVSGDLTKKGVILGSYRFMAPEQWEAKEADARSDIFSFGAVMYELLTGKRAFDGKSRASIIAAVMHTDPPPASSIDALSPIALDRVLMRCLDKDPDKRWQSAADLRDELQWVLEASPTQAFLPVPPVVERQLRQLKRRVWVLVGALAVALLAVVAVLGLWLRQPDPEAPLRRFTLVPDELSTANLQASPDGRHIAYLAGEPQRLWIQDLDRQEPREIEGTADARHPFWSPASDFIGFAQGTELKKVEVTGGPAVLVCPLPGAFDYFFTGAWSPDGASIVFSAGIPHRLYEVPAQGGSPELLVEPGESKQAITHAFPQFLPPEAGGRKLLFYSGAVNEGQIVALDIETGERNVVVDGGPFVYSRSGHILYQPNRDDASVLFALPFSATQMKARGEAFPVAQNAAYPSVTADGTLVTLDTGVRTQWQLTMRSRDGNLIGLFGQPQLLMWDPALSPDGTRVALAALEEDRDIWTHELGRPVKSNVTFDAAPDYAPIWSPSGDRLTFTSLRDGGRQILAKPPGGSGEAMPLMAGAAAHLVSDWSPDEQYLLYSQVDAEGGRDLWYLNRTTGE
ncbi:MAG: protein kinase, partial [bacterium]|nr:protein kinase [bacterium]